MLLKIYQIDAFTNNVFSGNPAAVCVLDHWIESAIMQKIASENNILETAFAVKKNTFYEIRWFTHTSEIDLRGHATLAAAYVIFNYYNFNETILEFYSPKSGSLFIEKEETDNYWLSFPSIIPKIAANNNTLNKALGTTPIQTLKTNSDYFLELKSEEEVKNLMPDYKALAKIKTRGIIVTAKGNEVDFVSRFFSPKTGINEDPVTGSTHCSLIPYWSTQLEKKELVAKQVSARGGDLVCEYLGNRVRIGGHAVLYMIGEIHIP